MQIASSWDPVGKIFIGLGNPGTEYERTYHNIGKLALLSAAGVDERGFVQPSHKRFAYFQTGMYSFVIPAEGYMNESGRFVKEALAYFKKDVHDAVVFHDDSDMKIGTFKFSYNQRSAGHHGIDSIIAMLGSSEFYRLKIGIRPESESVRKKAEEFVLKKISPGDAKTFELMFSDIRKSLRL